MFFSKRKYLLHRGKFFQKYVGKCVAMEYDEKKLFPLDVRHLHTKETFRQKNNEGKGV